MVAILVLNLSSVLSLLKTNKKTPQKPKHLPQNKTKQKPLGFNVTYPKQRRYFSLTSRMSNSREGPSESWHVEKGYMQIKDFTFQVYHFYNTN